MALKLGMAVRGKISLVGPCIWPMMNFDWSVKILCAHIFDRFKVGGGGTRKAVFYPRQNL